MDSWSRRFQEFADKCLLLPTRTAKMWKQLLGHMAFMDLVFPRGRARMRFLQW